MAVVTVVALVAEGTVVTVVTAVTEVAVVTVVTSVTVVSAVILVTVVISVTVVTPHVPPHPRPRPCTGSRSPGQESPIWGDYAIN